MAAGNGKIGENLLAEFYPAQVFHPNDLGGLTSVDFHNDVFKLGISESLPRALMVN